MTDTTKGPLDGIVVCDLSRVLAGPYCTMLLADMGATVIKVESAGGDDTRAWTPPVHEGEATYYLSINRNKQSIVLDFRDPDDVAVVPDWLVADDVGTVAPRLGVDSPCEQTTLGPRCLCCRQRIAADEVAFVELHEAAEAGLVRVVDRPILAAPRTKALVEAK